MSLLEPVSKKATDVVVSASKSGSIVKIEAVDHRAGWKFSFEQGPVSDFAEKMSSESAILSVVKTISGHIDLDEDGVPDAHFGNDSALQVENEKLKEDLAAVKAALGASEAARATISVDLDTAKTEAARVSAELEALKGGDGPQF